jgi:hypothetical protein
MFAMPRILLVSAVALLAAPRVCAQSLGQLLYANRAGRAISLKVVDGGHPTLMSLQRERGDAERFRLFILAHAGQEGLAARGARLLPEQAPSGWKVRENRMNVLLKTPEGIFWRYLAGNVLPVRFLFEGQAWELLSADLPPRMFVAVPGQPK